MSTTTESKHTPGPWHVANVWVGDDNTGIYSGTMALARVYTEREHVKSPIREWQANARLIAAAPAMLEALEYVASLTCGCQKAGDENWHSNRCAKPRVLAAIKLAVRS